MVFKWAHMFLVLLMVFCCEQEMNLIRLIKIHQQEKKDVEVQDAYKLIYQSVYGVAHILEFPERAKTFLVQEIASVDSSASEKMIEVISLSGDVVRLNLRPYKFYNGDPDLLFEAMVQSAESIRGSESDFLRDWEEFKTAVSHGRLTFDQQQAKRFDDEMKKAGYPEVHHSQGYRAANRPAYRVLQMNAAVKLLSRQKIQPN